MAKPRGETARVNAELCDDEGVVPEGQAGLETDAGFSPCVTSSNHIKISLYVDWVLNECTVEPIPE
jgi:adenylosuccinate synthase